MWKYLLMAFSFLFLPHCSDDDRMRQDIDCEKVACTEQFVTISIQVQDDDGVKIPLDEFKVTDKDTGADLSGNYSMEELEIFRQNGSYPIYNDNFVNEHRNENRSIVFRGFIKGEMVVEGIYVVHADCCHVSLFSGDEVLIINQDSQQASS